MARLVVMYKTPKQAEAFDRYYFESHVPLAKRIPGLRKYEVSKGPARGQAQSFISWVQSSKAARKIIQTGWIPLPKIEPALHS